jgi:hypothetical protein
MNAAKLTISEFDVSTNTTNAPKGIICVQGVTKRGPKNGTDEIIKSWARFSALYGGLITTSDFPLYCKLLLDAGVQLRVKRCMNEATAVKASLPSVPTTAIKGIGNSANAPLFDLPIKYHGSDYNNVRVIVAAASNGQANYFNLQINHLVDSGINELYENLIITGSPTIADSNYLNVVASGSQLVDVTYRDLSALVAPVRPLNGTYAYTAGANGDAVVAADYTGAQIDSSGWYAFDSVNDSISMMAPEIAIVTGGSAANPIIVGAVAYCAARKNMNYLAHFDNSITSPSNLVTARSGLSLDSSYFHMYCGGIKWVDPVTNITKNLLGLAHIGITMTDSDKNFGEHYSYAGLVRGEIKYVVGPVNNFSNPSTLDTLANAQINCIIRKNNKTVIWGNFTGQYSDSKLSQISVRRFLNVLKLELTPVLEKYIEAPNDIQSWKALYYEAKPLLDAYLNEKRALNSYDWQGDQFAKSMNELVVNTLPNINLGKYNVRLPLDIVNAIREIGLALYVTSTGVTLDEF